jgi:hypothetical protein
MAHPIDQLRALLLKPALVGSGTVIEVLRNNVYRVRMPSGSLEAVAAGNAAYLQGEEVLVSNGVIQGRVKNASTIPVYEV